MSDTSTLVSKLGAGVACCSALVGLDDVKTTLRGDSRVLKVAMAVMGMGATPRSDDSADDVRLSPRVGGGESFISA